MQQLLIARQTQCLVDGSAASLKQSTAQAGVHAPRKLLSLCSSDIAVEKYLHVQARRQQLLQKSLHVFRSQELQLLRRVEAERVL